MKEKIMEQSILLFGEKGFKETSIQDIVEALNVTKGTFYYYFKTKEEVLMDIQLTYIQRLVQKQEEIIMDKEKSCRERLHNIMFKLISDIEKEGLKAKVFFREIRHLTDDHLEEINRIRDRFRENIQALVVEGIEKGEFRSDLQVDIVSLGILGMTNWSYFWFDPNGRVSDVEVAKIFHEMLLRGINK